MRVGLVVVSHSALIAEGVRELALQMAPDVTILAAGGDADGGIGTDFARVSDALVAADSGAGVLVLADLGSAILTAESAIEFLDAERRSRVRVSPAPLVEGSVAAAVSAQLDAALEAVVAAALTAGDGSPARPDAAADALAAETSTPEVAPLGYSRRVVIVNREGLHARPAAEFAKLAARFPVSVQVNGRDGKSLLQIMSLGLMPGAEAEISTPDPDGRVAVDALADLIESGFETSPGANTAPSHDS
ncbi:HPr family phosphocarrier protein [Mycetocola tolaasinivorans]|uniref:Phosphocarrier protein HPr n=1 Tax=Mycetocola tolaasinivorans TaxID=76635 RepID=A0A3L7ADL8_9MICO|nr:dihydroxyacetone kinase phosphoryl donor subunit DhaM [Mycetocola tolaasinivorans]RLP78095.1 HPr family phosphocarrier protein [Mycetocola tolaasinivorans]